MPFPRLPAVPWLALLLLLSLALRATAEEAERPAPKTWVYVGPSPGRASKGISRSELDPATGKLSEPVLAGEIGSPSFLAIRPGGKFLYAVGETADFGGEKAGSVNAFAIDPKTGD